MKRVRMPGDGAVMNTSAGLVFAVAAFRCAMSRSSALRSLYFSGPTQPGNGNDAEVALAAVEVGMRELVAADHDVAALLERARVHRDALGAVADVGRIRRLAHLAVADDVDAGRRLLCDAVFYRLRGRVLEGLRVDGVAFFAAEDDVDQRLRPRQAAGVRGEDAVGAGLHVELPAISFGADRSRDCAVLSRGPRRSQVTMGARPKAGGPSRP